MTLDPQIAALLALFAADPAARPIETLTPAEVRERLVKTARAFAGRPEPMDAVEDRTIAGPESSLRIRIYTPRGAAAVLPGIVFFHGGGWVAGSLDSHDLLCRALCAGSGARLVAIDYRLAPEHCFPAAVLDAIAAAQWVAAHAAGLGIDPSRLAVAGDSAGGNLAAVVAQHARAHGPALGFQLLIYPVTDTRTDTPSYVENAHGYALERAGMMWFLAHYAPDPHDPRAAPLRADLANLPPALILTAGHDPLRDDGRAYAAALERAGNVVTLRDYEGLIHGFATMGGVSDVSREAIAAAARSLGDALKSGIASPGR